MSIDEAIDKFAKECEHDGIVTHWALVISSSDGGDGGGFSCHGPEGQAKHLTLGLLEAGKVLIKSDVYNAVGDEYDE